VPTDENTLRTSGMRFSSAAACRLASRVWRSVAPGASSTVIEVCALSDAGKKPVGSSGISASDRAMNSAVPSITRGRRRRQARTAAR